MLHAIIGMPYEMAMEGEIARRQFHSRAQDLLADYDILRTANQRLEAENAQLKSALANNTARRFVGDDDQREMDELVAAGIRVDQQEIKRLSELLHRVQVSLSLDDTEWGYSATGKYRLLADIKAALSTNGEVTE